MKLFTKRVIASIAVFAATIAAAYAIKAIKADAYCGFNDPQMWFRRASGNDITDAYVKRVGLCIADSL